MKTLYTRWGKDLDTEHVLSEYPRPLMRRKSYINLNGYWDYRICRESGKRPPRRKDSCPVFAGECSVRCEAETPPGGNTLVSPDV